MTNKQHKQFFTNEQEYKEKTKSDSKAQGFMHIAATTTKPC